MSWIDQRPDWQVFLIFGVGLIALLGIIMVPCTIWYGSSMDESCANSCRALGSSMVERNSYGCICADGTILHDDKPDTQVVPVPVHH